MFNPAKVDRVIKHADGMISFTLVNNFQERVPPGVYRMDESNYGYCFRPHRFQASPIHPDPEQQALVDEIATFWASEERYAALGFQHKRGVLFHGPPGTGKSTMLRLLVQDVVKAGGIAVYMTSDDREFDACTTYFRQVTPKAPLLVMMEDLDRYSADSDVLNCLDGLQPLDHVLFVATTNHLDQVNEAFLRPSRFDRQVNIAFPSEAVRRAFITGCLAKAAEHVDVEALVRETSGKSIAETKEALLLRTVYSSSAAMSAKAYP